MTTRNRELASIIDDSGNITAGGNLTVSGTTTTVSSTVETHADPLIELNTGAGSNANDLGFVFERGSTGDNACLIWDESNDGFVVGTTSATGTSTGNMSFTAGDFAAGKITVDSVLINGTTIGHTSDPDLLTIADGLVTVAGEISVTTLDIGGTNVSSTAAELNILDGVNSTAAELNILDGVTATAAEINFLDGDTSATGTTLASADRVIVNDGGTMKQVALSDFETFFESEIDTFSTIDINGGSIDGATVGANSASSGAFTTLTVDDINLNGKVVTMTGSTDDTAVLTVGTNGTLSIVTVDTAAAAANIQITADGTVDIDSAGVLTLDSGAAINIEPAAGSAILLDGTISIDGGVITNASSITSTAFVGTLSTAAQTNITSLGTLTGLDVNGAVTINDNLSLDGSNKELRFYEGANYVGFEAPALSANQIWVLPTVDGDANQTLKTDGSGTLSWATAASAVSNLTDVTISSLASNDYLRYSGSAWVNVAQASNPVIDTMTGDGSDTTLTLTQAPLHENATLVTISGVVQHKSTYSISGTTLTFSTAPPDGSAVECITNVNTNVMSGNDVAVDTMTGDNSDTTLSLSVTPSNENHVNIYFNGVYQEKSGWSLSGTTVTFSTAPPTGVTVEAVSNQMLAVGTATALSASVISGSTLVTAVGADHLLVYDATDGALKKALVSDVIEQATTEEIQDIAGAMFTSNTETGITATYQDGDGTIDLVVGTLNQDTTGLAATATALATARTIGGTSFDGTANIVPATVTVTDSTANTNFPVVFHNESNGLLDDTGALRYNPSTGQLLVPNLTVAGTTTTVDTVTMNAANAIIFEGATADNYETTLSIIDPTADHTQYLINQDGYIPVLAVATTTAISSTPAELNLLDGSVANTVVNSKAVIYGGSGQVAGTLSTAAQTNITSLGTLTTLTVDELTINADTITASDDFVIDCAVDITLDAAGDQIRFKDAGTEVGHIDMGSSNLGIRSTVSDKDIIFYGNDSDSDITAMTIDMSAGGRVGIGETTPLGQLHVKSGDSGVSSPDITDLVVECSASGGLSLLGATNGQVEIAFGDSGDANIGRIAYNHNSNYLATVVNAAERMRIHSSGNISLACTSDYKTLTVGDTDAEAWITAGGTNTHLTISPVGQSGALIIKTGSTNSDPSDGVERMRIMPGGDVLIGQTSQTGYVYAQKLVVGDGDANDGITIQSGSTHQGNLAFNKADGTTAYGRIMYQHDSNYMLFMTNNDEKMRIESGGNVGIGTGSDVQTKFHVQGSDPTLLIESTNDTNNTGNRCYLEFRTDGNQKIGKIVGGKQGNYQGSTVRLGYLGFHTNDIDDTSYERMRIHSTGGVSMYIQDTTVTSSTNALLHLQYTQDADVGDGTKYAVFARSGTTIGSITALGAAVVYNTSSDRNLKENIVDVSSQLETIKKVKVREFDWKGDSRHDVGLIAQELNSLIPNVVTEGSDELDAEGLTTPWSIDYGKLTPYLTKAIQELSAKNDALEARLAILEG
jgi:hypothetical protein